MATEGGRYHRLYVNEWHHPNFRRLNDSARLVRWYVTAGPQTTSVGCFRLSTAVAVEELGGTAEQFEGHLAAVCEAFGWAWDPLARVIWIRDWFESRPPASPNVVASWAKLLRNVPECAVRDEAIASIAVSLKNLPLSFREPWAELQKSFRRTEVRSEVRPETNQVTGSRYQGSGSKVTGAFRADGSERNKDASTNEPKDPRWMSIADETRKLIGPNASPDNQVDTFQNVAQLQNIKASRADVISFLGLDRQEQKSA